MKETVIIRCKNNMQTVSVPVGSTLGEVYRESGLDMKYGPISAKVNNKVEGLQFRVYNNKDVEFLDMYSSSGQRAYTRTLFFVLCKTVHELYPEGEVMIDIPVSNGYYCDLRIGHDVTEEDVEKIRTRMQDIVKAAIPVRRHLKPTEEVLQLFKKKDDASKVKLMQSTGRLYTVYYDIDGYYDYYYGSLLRNTSELYLFDVVKYYDGLLLRLPSRTNPGELAELTRQDKMFEIFKEHHRWQDVLGLRTIGDLNEAIVSDNATQLINVSEALQEKKIVNIADDIAARGRVKMVLIAGPSSSGKTTTCKRLSIQLVANGIRPVPLSLDDYFVDRDKTPRDASGDYDFESLYSLNLPLLNQQLKALLSGEEVELPRYNFQTGKSEWSGKKMKLSGNEVLVVEGIHALNPELTSQIPDNQKYKVYASALTSILLDTHNYIPTTDNRLLRRIIRDYKYRGVSAQESIRRWPSVRAGENKWIFPFQENADAMINTAMLFELATIKTQAEPLLEQVPENSEQYSEAYRLLRFLRYIKPLPANQVPPTSLLREFLGGSSFKY